MQALSFRLSFMAANLCLIKILPYTFHSPEKTANLLLPCDWVACASSRFFSLLLHAASGSVLETQKQIVASRKSRNGRQKIGEDFYRNFLRNSMLFRSLPSLLMSKSIACTRACKIAFRKAKQNVKVLYSIGDQPS